MNGTPMIGPRVRWLCMPAVLALSASCGGSHDSSATVQPNLISFVSGKSAEVDENEVDTNYVARAVSTNGAIPRYSIAGGADRALFDIDRTSGRLSFDAPP